METNKYDLNMEYLTKKFFDYDSSIKMKEVEEFINALLSDVLVLGLEDKFARLHLDKNYYNCYGFYKYLKNKNLKGVRLNYDFYLDYLFVSKDLDTRLEFFINNYNRTSDVFDMYEKLFDEKERSDENVISYIVESNHELIPIVYRYIRPEDKHRLLDYYAIILDQYCQGILSEEDQAYVLKRLKDKNIITYVNDEEYIYTHDLESFGKINYVSLRKIINDENVSRDDIYTLITIIRGRHHTRLARKKFEACGLANNHEKFIMFMNYVLPKIEFNKFQREQNAAYENFIEEFFYHAFTLEDKIKFFSIYCDTKYNIKYNNLCEFVFSDEELHQVDILDRLIQISSDNCFKHLYKYFDSNNKPYLFEKYYAEISNGCMDLLTEKDKAVIVDLLKQNEKFEPFLYNGEYYKSYIELLMAKRESPLLEKLQARYGESYKKVKGKDPKDADVFFWDMINSNVLKEIYCNPYFTNDDLLTLISAITDIEIRGIDITPVNKRIDKILHDLRILENSLFNKIVSLQNDDERLEEYLKSMKITKDNYSKYIRERKYLDKKMKESLLLILSKHYKTDYVSLYDILEMIQISDETGQPLKEIVKERNIDYKYFINIYNKLAKERPDLFEIIKMADKDEINRLKIYSSIKNSRVHSIGVFKNKYKRTPEEVLAMFEDSVLFDEVFGMLSSWYEFEPKEDKDNQIKKNKSNKKATL